LARTASGILAGGDDGLFEISADLSHIVPAAHGSVDSIGSVHDILDVGFAGIAIVQSADGTYAFEDGGLMRVPDLSAAAHAETPVVLPSIRRVLATKRLASGPLLFEFGRRDQAGRCRDPIASRVLR
jgi:hypothetical protein